MLKCQPYYCIDFQEVCWWTRVFFHATITPHLACPDPEVGTQNCSLVE